MYTPDLAGHITSSLIDGASPPGFQNHVRGKLKYISKWKNDPDKVVEMMTKASRDFELVEIMGKDKAHREGSKPGSPSAKTPQSGDKSEKNEEDRFQCSIISFGYGEQDHIQGQCEENQQGGGAGGNGGGGEAAGKSGGVSGGAAG